MSAPEAAQPSQVNAGTGKRAKVDIAGASGARSGGGPISKGSDRSSNFSPEVGVVLEPRNVPGLGFDP